jgi:predicted Rossmann fold flavoprotein
MKRIVVIGAGAAGTMAAIFAATRGAETLLLERTKDGGRKILISGGGRCNILPAIVHESRFVTDSSPHTLRKMLRSWPLGEQIAFFKGEAGIPLMEEPESAKLFPQSESACDVRDRLLALARARGVLIETGALVDGLLPTGNGWQIERQGRFSLRADAVVIATGGLSVPSTGSDGLGLGIVATLGHTINRTYPALTPLTSTVRLKPETAGGAPFAKLSGVSLPVTLTALAGTLKSTSTGGFLFTHHGYSGPAVLDVSHVAVRSRDEMGSPARLVVSWTSLNDKEWESALGPRGSRTVLNAVAAHVPRRLAEALIEFVRIDLYHPLSQLTRDERLRLIDILVRGELPWSGDEGYRKAEVTGGGVRLSEIDPKTMESKIHKGLFLCGEMLDAFGPIGGYNFLWAWATGRAAGLGASRTQ